MKVSYGPATRGNGIMDHWLFYTMIAISAIVGIIGIDYCFAKRRSIDLRRSGEMKRSGHHHKQNKRNSGSFEILAFIRGGGNRHRGSRDH